MGEAVPQLFQLVSMPSKLHHSNKPDQVLIGPPLLLAQEPAAREEQAGRCLVNRPPLHRDILEEERKEDRPQPKPLLLQQGPRKSQGNLHRPRIRLLRAQVRSQGKHRHQEMMMGGPEDLPPHQCKKWHPRKLFQREHRQHRPSISPGRPNHTLEGAWWTICEFLASHWQMQG